MLQIENICEKIHALFCIQRSVFGKISYQIFPTNVSWKVVSHFKRKKKLETQLQYVINFRKFGHIELHLNLRKLANISKYLQK